MTNRAKFEVMTIDELFEYLQDNLDSMNDCPKCMLDIMRGKESICLEDHCYSCIGKFLDADVDA